MEGLVKSFLAYASQETITGQKSPTGRKCYFSVVKPSSQTVSASKLVQSKYPFHLP